nr:interferon-inducible double-stranded RNA-dependent protein kinase activator A homolog isoform X1 [Helicoverpa armigera]
MKSSVSVLHEFMAQLRQTPKFECISEFGKQHKPVFRYRCTAINEVVTGTGRTKKEAKQLVARLMLQQLAQKGYLVPGEYATPAYMREMMKKAGLPERSYVRLNTELCKDYNLNAVEYEVSPDTGTRDHPRFTVTARIGLVERVGVASTKKQAYQLAAEQIYKHLRTKLGVTAAHFNEEDALFRAYEKGLERNAALQEALHNARLIQIEKARAAAKTAAKKKPVVVNEPMMRPESPPQSASDVVAETIRLELNQMDAPPPEYMNETLPEPNVAGYAAANAAVMFIERTMERLGL